VWTYYGSLMKDLSVLVPNSLGILAGGLSSMIFMAFSAVLPWKQFGAVAAVVSLATYYYLKQSALEVGLIGCFLAGSHAQ
jgi:hypothetical protein